MEEVELAMFKQSRSAGLLSRKKTNVRKNPRKSEIPPENEQPEASAVETPDFAAICRLCATKNDHVIPIFEGEGAEHDFSKKIHQYLPIQVSRDDTLPRQLCYHCAATILAWHELLEGCVEAEKTLLQMEIEINNKETLQHEFKETKISSGLREGFISVEDELVDDPEPVTSWSEEQIYLPGKTEEANTTAPSVPSLEEKERSGKSEKPFKIFLDTQNICQKSRVLKIEVREGAESAETIWRDVLYTSIAHHQLPSFESPVPGPEAEVEDLEEVRIEESSSTKPAEHSDLGASFKSAESIEPNVIGNCAEENTEQSSPSVAAHAKQRNKYSPETRNKIYQCVECAKNFRLKDSFVRHQRIHRDERPFTCHVCGKQFRDSGGLSRHLKDVHAKLKNFACDICAKSFSSKATRDDHRRTHTGERPYVCATCNKSFKSKACLYSHNKLHTNEFPHPCAYCGKKFRRRQEMLVHATTHTGEKNYSCDICYKRFRVKTEVVRHKLTHSDEKPFVCAKCGLRFRQNRYLNNHVKTRHVQNSKD